MDENFSKKIAEDFGLTEMDSREQENMIEKIGNLLFESIIERAVDIMDEETMSDFETAVSEAGSDYQKVVTFLKTRIKGFDKIVSEELTRLKRATTSIFT